MPLRPAPPAVSVRPAPRTPCCAPSRLQWRGLAEEIGYGGDRLAEGVDPRSWRELAGLQDWAGRWWLRSSVEDRVWPEPC